MLAERFEIQRNLAKKNASISSNTCRWICMIYCFRFVAIEWKTSGGSACWGSTWLGFGPHVKEPRAMSTSNQKSPSKDSKGLAWSLGLKVFQSRVLVTRSMHSDLQLQTLGRPWHPPSGHSRNHPRLAVPRRLSVITSNQFLHAWRSSLVTSSSLLAWQLFGPTRWALQNSILVWAGVSASLVSFLCQSVD